MRVSRSDLRVDEIPVPSGALPRAQSGHARMPRAGRERAQTPCCRAKAIPGRANSRIVRRTAKYLPRERVGTRRENKALPCTSYMLQREKEKRQEPLPAGKKPEGLWGIGRPLRGEASNLETCGQSCPCARQQIQGASRMQQCEHGGLTAVFVIGMFPECICTCKQFHCATRP